MFTAKHTREDGFTLIEILVVILIIGILASIAVAVFLNQKKASQEASVKSDLKNLGVEFETALTNGGTGAYPDTIPADFKRSEGNILTIAPESGNTNVASGTQKTSTTLNPGIVAHYSSVYYPTRTVEDGVFKSVYPSTETRITVGGPYWQYRPDAGSIPAGDSFTGSLMVRSTEDTCFRLQFEMHKSTPGWTVTSGNNTCLTANTWTKMPISGVTPYEVTVITMIAYSSHNPGTTMEYRDPVIVLGSSINEEQFNIARDQRFCVQGYNVSNPSKIWNYSSLNGGVREGRC